MNLAQALGRSASLFPQRAAVEFGGKAVTYAELHDRVRRLAGALQADGVNPDDRIAVFAPNCVAYVELFHACAYAGAVIVPVNCRLSVQEAAEILSETEPRVVFCDAVMAPLAQDALRTWGKAARLVVINATSPIAEGQAIDYTSFLAGGHPYLEVKRLGADIAGIFYTGGTTGRQRGAMISHGALYAAALTMLVERVVGRGGRFLAVAPMFHMAGAAPVFATAVAEGTIIPLPAFDPAVVAATLERSNVTDAVLVPTMIRALTDHLRKTRRRLQRPDRLTYGASPISESLLREAMQRMPRTAFSQAYGSTETSAMGTVLAPEFHRKHDARLRSAGRPVVCADLRVMREDGSAAAIGEVGEVQLRSPTVMSGYWRLPDETAKVLADGWYRTGDAGRLDAEGFLYVVDRVKDMIVSGGENIYSAEVENALASHPNVAACAVIGIPDPKWGEAVHAVVVLKDPRKRTTENELIQHCRGAIAGFKCPKSVEFRTALPISAAGKILKRELRESFWRSQSRAVN
ncbi:MAG TPA: long-chain-fatty-acid--CoA ligase [Caulobacteraceae bacterium]|jgi:long-chain acyl-CoA synthetase|nr:long-chain-fatty-acid--CoA ligase [Caulobacteraceae bacterium]